MRSFWSEAEEIWEICEPSKFPHKPCYLSRRLKGGERSGVRSEAEQVEKEGVHQMSECDTSKQRIKAEIL